ncbi:hypothetical protein [Mycobacteroides abscessus]|uniref:hypothetical protein n=1 Tax=Mycobacteroides abscessus TaxID=36809 RepID=UPI0009A818F6|nr:hypothetical protein [Mycobacteroides abscessus]RIT47244.1 hypothetical protein D2E80_14420 [Mycobacteroides abscessus]SKF91597.1 Uncharacterised protein [Mycobacteroides abscessus subsp. massiliense]SKG05511.1 Uncharacterised protein [Mycobacteroides abscessus subsp. massiliense]SKG23721.1 Uncharacterised protein [Mycobacteroides abscessus subsp. massiliense]SKG76917.1 Uncharacterised protein [Mycobacteroides abscessus subsp. massiliense]
MSFMVVFNTNQQRIYKADGDTYEVHPSGALVLTVESEDNDGKRTHVLAPGQWIEVTEDDPAILPVTGPLPKTV